MSERIRLVDIAERLPTEARHWLTLMGAGDYVSTETIMNYCGLDSFVEHWRVHQADHAKIVYDFTPGWPGNVIEKFTGKRQGRDITFFEVSPATFAAALKAATA
jgi:hypothetical protein